MESFFTQYASAFVDSDADKINACYTFPMAFYSEQGQLFVMQEEAFANNTLKLLQKYRQLELAAVDFELLEQQSLSDALALVSVLWQFKRIDGAEIYRATTRYLLNTNTKSIVSVVVVDETTAWRNVMVEQS